MANKENTEIAQGILFLIDNTGPCPANKKFRQFTDAAIAHHLTQHTYYYQDHGRPGAKNKKRVTARKFRSVFKDLWEHTRPENRGRETGDVAEALFRLKSGGIEADKLKMFEYDPEDFPETKLPIFVDEDDDHPQSQQQTQTVSASGPQAHVRACPQEEVGLIRRSSTTRGKTTAHRG